MSRRLPALAATALAAALAAAFAPREDAAAPSAARTASGRMQYVVVPDPEAEICTSPEGHLHLRLSRELGTPARPTLSGDPGARPRDLLLRMDRMLDTVLPLAHAAAPGSAAPASGEAAEVPADATPPAEAAPAPRRTQQRGPIRLELLERSRDLGEPAEESGAFAPKSWVVVVPPPPPPPPPPPEPPRAPPLQIGRAHV